MPAAALFREAIDTHMAAPRDDEALPNAPRSAHGDERESDFLAPCCLSDRCLSPPIRALPSRFSGKPRGVRIFRRRSKGPRPITEAEAYARSYGHRDSEVRLVAAPPRRPRYKLRISGEELRRLFEERLDRRTPS